MALIAPKLAIRRALSAVARRVLRARSQPFPLEAAAVTLVLAPHQDDEALGCGGLIPLVLGAGHQVHVTYVTDGSASQPGHPNLTALRRAEAFAATALLGVSSDRLEFLDARDGSLASLNGYETAALIGQFAATLNRVRPTLVLLPCRADGSSEHDAAFALFDQALATTGARPRVLEFPVWSWWNPLLLRRSLRTKRRIWRATFSHQAPLKQQALACYVTQVQALEPGTEPMLTPAYLSFFAAPEEFFFEQ